MTLQVHQSSTIHHTLQIWVRQHTFLANELAPLSTVSFQILQRKKTSTKSLTRLQPSTRRLPLNPWHACSRLQQSPAWYQPLLIKTKYCYIKSESFYSSFMEKRFFLMNKNCPAAHQGEQKLFVQWSILVACCSDLHASPWHTYMTFFFLCFPARTWKGGDLEKGKGWRQWSNLCRV